MTVTEFFERLGQDFERARYSLLARVEAYADAVGTALIAIVALGLMAGHDYWNGHPERLPMTTLYIGSWLLMFILPVVLVWRHRRRQQRVITKVRSLFAMAVEWLMQGRNREAHRALRSIRRWEKHWQIGNSGLYRLIYSAFVIGATTSVAALHFVAYANVYSRSDYQQVPHESLGDTMWYLLDHPIQLWFIGLFSLALGFKSAEYLKDLEGASWSEFYGDRLEAALKAGRTVNEAPWHDRPLPTAATSARELLGLPENFTSAQLRRAWLSLVRELHPDRWVTAGDEVRRMKEAALKRVNSARDELATQVTD